MDGLSWFARGVNKSDFPLRMWRVMKGRGQEDEDEDNTGGMYAFHPSHRPHVTFMPSAFE